MVWRRPGSRALIAVLTVVLALLPVSSIAAVSAFAGDSARPGGNSGAGPVIVGFAPHKGSIHGGTVVHISGGGFNDVAGVWFGTHKARAFRVRSENLIDAVAPRQPHGNAVRIVVAASGGASISNSHYLFIGCHVPRVKHYRLGPARKAITAAGCRTGRVTRSHTAREPLRVIAVHPRPGAWLGPGAPVRLRVR